MQAFLAKVCSQYQVVAEPVTLRKALLAWEFDPDIFVSILHKTLGLFREAGVKYDLLHARPPGSPQKMVDQGFNLSPNAKGNDWPHISIGMFDRLKPEELGGLLSVARSYKPTFKLLRFGTLEAATSGLSYLVLDLWANIDQTRFEKSLKARHRDNFMTYSDKGFPYRPHVSILGFSQKDMTKVLLITQKLNNLFEGKTIKPEALQLWQNFHVVKHIYLKQAAQIERAA